VSKLTPEQLNRYVVDEIRRAATELDVPVEELSADQIMELRDALGQVYGSGGGPLTFETMTGKASRQKEDGYLDLAGFLRSGPHTLFYDSPGFADQAGVRFADGAGVSPVLAECFGFPFYVTDEEHTFVVGMNDHDYLIGVGTAAPWVASLS